jgi:hypothetical protein
MCPVTAKLFHKLLPKARTALLRFSCDIVQTVLICVTSVTSTMRTVISTAPTYGG